MPEFRASPEERAREIYERTYYLNCNLNRTQRRTVHGKIIEAEARIKALEAELEFWREEKEFS